MTNKFDDKNKTLGDALRSRGISRRSFLKFCAATASMMALPPAMIPKIAHALETRAYRGVGQAMRRNPYAPEVP